MLPAHQQKRRKIEKEEHLGWTALKTIKNTAIEIPQEQRKLLELDESWVGPENIHQFQPRKEVEEQVLPEHQAVINNGHDHPPLSSPEEEPVQDRELSQFQTQVPPMMSESQLNLGPAEPTRQVSEEPGEPLIGEWTPSPDRIRRAV